MNASNSTPGFYELLQYPDEEEHEFERMVGVVPAHVYLGVIYFILVFGSIGNACIIALMQDRDFHKLSYPVYLRLLAVSDTLLLACVATEDILDHQYRRLGDFLMYSLTLCKFWNYISSLGKLSSPWLVVAMTFDRFVAVVYPLKRAVFCCRRTALIVCSVVLGAIASETLFYPILSKRFPEESDCSVKESAMDYIIFRTLVIETSLPCVLILFLNVYIIIAINRSRKFRASSTGTKQTREAKTSRLDKATVSLMAVSVMAFVALVPISTLQVCYLLLRRTSGESKVIYFKREWY